MDVFWGITLALWAYVFIPFLILRVSDWVKDRRAIRKDRQRIELAPESWTGLILGD